MVAGLNEAYALDRGYRTAHHGEALMPAARGVLKARRLEPGSLDLGGGLVARAAEVNHGPIRPTLAYRFDYQGRSVVISGDTVISDALVDLAQGADLLLHDALSMPLIQAMAAVARRAGVGQLALYHLVPAFDNALLERIFRRGLPDDAIVVLIRGRPPRACEEGAVLI